MSTQIVRAFWIRNSSIVQIATEAPVPPPGTDKPVYFTYGDSDVQDLVYKIGRDIPEEQYYRVMERAFRLLAAFKPLATCIVIPTSSVIQSNLTARLITEYRSLCEDLEYPHFCLLRRESSWQEYMDKRHASCSTLRALRRYSPYYSSRTRAFLEPYRTVNLNRKAGRSCVDIWAPRAAALIPQISGSTRFTAENLRQMGHAILSNSIFVWEELYPLLVRYGLTLPPWSSELQVLFTHSYLSIGAVDYDYPIGIGLPWDFWRTAPHSLLTNLTLLSHIDRICSSVTTLSDLTPVAFRRFIEHPSMIEFRAHLRRETSEDGVVTAALAHKMLYSEALHCAQVP